VLPIYLALGDKGRTLTALETSTEQQSWFATFLNVEPGLDTLRNEPRFQALLQRLNFSK
jgi:hypothetical protein